MFFLSLPRYQQIAFLIGAVIGLALSAILFFTVPVYHNLVVWCWTTPGIYVIGIPAFIAGVFLAHLSE